MEKNMRESCVHPAIVQIPNNTDENGAKAGWYMVTSSDYQNELSGPFPDREKAQEISNAIHQGAEIQRNLILTKLSVEIATLELALRNASVNNHSKDAEKFSERVYALESCFAMIAGINQHGPALRPLIDAMQKSPGGVS
jgi:DNA invertase Pin-like site-specific DNA recombinase